MAMNPTLQKEQNPWAPLAEMIADMVVARLEAKHNRLLSPKEAAAYIQRSVSWLRAEVASGRIKCVREGNARPRFDREALDRWIEEQTGYER